MKSKLPKMKLNELTFCIPVRIDSKYRMRNLRAVLEFYSRHVNANYFILEADSEQRVEELPAIGNLHYEFIKDENVFFHRTHYINKMLSNVKSEVAAIWDVDVIVPTNQLSEAYDAIMKDNIIITYPYNGVFWAINEFFSAVFCRNYEIELFRNYPIPKTLLGGYHSVGGAFLVDVEEYRKCGWENEYFITWGPEDQERFRRMQILGYTPLRIKGELYHLYHSRGINSGYSDKELEYLTRKEHSKVCGMLPDELREYINTWQWTQK